jgi:carbon-monoxide dehydrogenase medium subunit
MKAARFDYVRARSLGHAFDLLGAAEEGAARLIAGGQSLGPMLNLRLVQPALLVDISRLTELAGHRAAGEGGVVIGAAVTHAAIEDGSVPDPTGGILRRVAFGIAYRAVRNRGTIGGSLAHADPAADWPTALAALNAECLIAGGGGERIVPVAGFARGVFETALVPGEVLSGIRVLAPPAGARWGFYKFCRKAGEFAEAMAAVLIGKEVRAVIGALHGPPIVLDPALFARSGDFDVPAVAAILAAAGVADESARRIHLASLKRALRQAQS